MYRIIIINSNKAEGESLSVMVGSEFSVAGVFDNCSAALDFFRENGADIIITDVTGEADAVSVFMSSGAEVLALCSYRDMAEAKALSDIGVSYYLLKPVRFDEFSYALSSVKLALDRRNISRLQDIETLDFGQFLPILREQFFAEVANGKISSRQMLREQAAKHSMEQSICGMPCTFTEVHITEYHNYITNKWKYGRETLYTAIKNLLSDTTEFSFQLIKTSGSVMSFVVVPTKHISIRTLEDSLRLYIMKSTRQAFEMFGLVLFIDNKKFFPSLFDMMEYTSGEKRDSESSGEYANKIYKLSESLKLYRTEEARGILREFSELPSGSSAENAAGFLLNIMFIVCDSLFTGDVLLEMRKKTEDAIIRPGLSYNELLQSAGGLISDFVACLKKNSKRSDDIVISKAKQFIKENCTKDISLGDVAEYVYLSPVYLSRMFKQKTGENFSDYILRIRMERAAELLAAGGAKVKDVASEVGFKNVKYFSRLFKKFTGCSPREYGYIYLEAKK